MVSGDDFWEMPGRMEYCIWVIVLSQYAKIKNVVISEPGKLESWWNDH